MSVHFHIYRFFTHVRIFFGTPRSGYKIHLDFTHVRIFFGTPRSGYKIHLDRGTTSFKVIFDLLQPYLTRRWYPDCSWPVIIEVSQLVGQALDLVRFQASLVMHDDVVCWTNSTLADMLTDQEEIVAAKLRNT
jgi:hypothetical protein